MKLFFLKKIFSSSEKPPSGPTTKSTDENSSTFWILFSALGSKKILDFDLGMIACIID